MGRGEKISTYAWDAPNRGSESPLERAIGGGAQRADRAAARRTRERMGPMIARVSVKGADGGVWGEAGSAVIVGPTSLFMYLRGTRLP